MIQNVRNGKIIAVKKRECRSIFSRAKGLMYSKRIKDEGLVFFFDKEKITSLHMFFVFFPIDVLFLDKNKKVIDVKENFKPFTFYANKKPAMYVIELPQDAIKKTNTKLGDRISF